MLNDKNYSDLSEEVYDIDSKKMFKIKKEGELILDNKFQILSLEDNQNNGMQAMAVAPVNDRGEVDTSKIVIV
ncbi:hypothetical protein [Gemella morbillorum]|jgi:hypothetical protein|uniref:hypothetical protein n=1 Tax=Gemella morbillorum TaxID=29391 RepID=UPI0028D8FF8F|nr:hypothetical protein [Gemella morbillorum]